MINGLGTFLEHSRAGSLGIPTYLGPDKEHSAYRGAGRQDMLEVDIGQGFLDLFGLHVFLHRAASCPGSQTVTQSARAGQMQFFYLACVPCSMLDGPA
jgi:hypothetical protein